MTGRMVIARLGTALFWTAIFAIWCLVIADPTLAAPGLTPPNAASSCNCDLKGLVAQLQNAQATRDRLLQENVGLAELVSRSQQQLLKDAAIASEGIDPYTDTAAVVAWNAFSLLMDASLDWADAKLNLGKESLDLDGIDVAGPGWRSAKILAKKATVKGSKIGKAVSGSDNKTLKMLAALANPLIESAAQAMQQMSENQTAIAQTRSIEKLAWSELLEAECLAALKDYCQTNAVGSLGKQDITAVLAKVFVPPEMQSLYTDRDLEEQFFAKGFLREDLSEVRQTLSNTGYFKERAYRYQMAVGQIATGQGKATADCRVCLMLEELRALSILSERIDALETDWRQAYLKLLRSVIGSHTDLVKLWKIETKGVSSKITSHNGYKLTGLAFSLFRLTSPAGTALSMAEAVSATSQALGELYYKAPVAEEIKRNARLTQLFSDGIKMPLQDMATTSRQLAEQKARLLKTISACANFRDCPQPKIIRIAASRSGETLYQWATGQPRPQVSRAIDQGDLNLELTFDTDMDPALPTEVAVEVYGEVLGDWRGPRVWAGLLEIPGGEALGRLAGWRSVSVVATALSGLPLKLDPPTPGLPQLLQDARLHFEPGRPLLLAVRVVGNNKTFYASRDGLDFTLPPGSYQMVLDFDRPMQDAFPVDASLEPPVVIAKKEASLHDVSSILKDGTKPIRVQGAWQSQRRWEGRFELPDGEAFTRLAGLLTLSVQAQSKAGRKLDTDPATDGEQPDRNHQLRLHGDIAMAVEITGCWYDLPFGPLEITSSDHGRLIAEVPVITLRAGNRRLTFVGDFDAATRSLHLEHVYTTQTLPYFLYPQDPAFSQTLASGVKYVLDATLVEKPFHFSPAWPMFEGTRSNGLGANNGKIYMIRYPPGFHSIAITEADYRTPRQTVKSGEPFWIVAHSRESCPSTKDTILLQLDADPNVFAPRQVILEETGADSGEFRSPAAGVSIRETLAGLGAMLKIQAAILLPVATTDVSPTVIVPFLTSGQQAPMTQVPQPRATAPSPVMIPVPPRFEMPTPAPEPMFEPEPLLEPEPPGELRPPR